VNPTLRGSFCEPTAPRPRLRTAPKHVLPPETDSRGSRVLPGGRRRYSRLRTPPPHRPYACSLRVRARRFRLGGRHCGGNFLPSHLDRVRDSQPMRPRKSHRGVGQQLGGNFRRVSQNRERKALRARRGFYQSFSAVGSGGKGGRNLWAVVRLRPTGIPSRMRGRKWLSHIGTLERGGVAGSRAPTRRPQSPSARLAGGFTGVGSVGKRPLRAGPHGPSARISGRVFENPLAAGWPICNRDAAAKREWKPCSSG